MFHTCIISASHRDIACSAKVKPQSSDPVEDDINLYHESCYSLPYMKSTLDQNNGPYAHDFNIRSIIVCPLEVQE